MKRRLHIVVALAALMHVGCAPERRVNYQHDVEIAPDRWLTLREQRGKCWFLCEWSGKEVYWPGKRDHRGENALPVTLREHDGRLYLIAQNRENFEDPKLEYYRLDNAGRRFARISPQEFPKQIATQNMQLDPEFVGVGNEWINGWDVLRKLDVDHPYFVGSVTAEIWIQLETGLNPAQISGPTGLSREKRKQHVREYAEKHRPIALPGLIRKD